MYCRTSLEGPELSTLQEYHAHKRTKGRVAVCNKSSQNVNQNIAGFQEQYLLNQQTNSHASIGA